MLNHSSKSLWNFCLSPSELDAVMPTDSTKSNFKIGILSKSINLILSACPILVLEFGDSDVKAADNAWISVLVGIPKGGKEYPINVVVHMYNQYKIKHYWSHLQYSTRFH